MALVDIGDLARRAGVSTRTLRYYEARGLLRPAGRSESGRRQYGDGDVARLQQILTLKLIGLSLDEIRGLLTTDVVEMRRLLARQRTALAAQAQHLARVMATLDAAAAAMQGADAPDLDALIDVIRMVAMHQQTDWLGEFLDEGQQAALAASAGTLAEQRSAGMAWRRLFADVFAAMDGDADDATVAVLAERWDALVMQTAGGDPALAEQISRAYAHLSGAAEGDAGAYAQRVEAAARFIERARRRD